MFNFIGLHWSQLKKIAERKKNYTSATGPANRLTVHRVSCSFMDESATCKTSSDHYDTPDHNTKNTLDTNKHRIDTDF